MEAFENKHCTIDADNGISVIGDEQMYYEMLQMCDPEIIKHLERLAKNYKTNLHEFMLITHAFKGICGYLSAPNLYRLLLQSKGAYINMDFQLQNHLYPEIVKESILLRVKIKQLLAHKNGAHIKQALHTKRTPAIMTSHWQRGFMS